MNHPHSLGIHLAVAALTTGAQGHTPSADITLAVIAVANAIAACAIAYERIRLRGTKTAKKPKPRQPRK